MPNNVVKTPHDEKLWNKAKEIAEQEGQKENYKYIMAIYQKMKGITKSIIQNGKLLIKKSKYDKPLTGGRWVTITDRSSPLHGRHIYITSNGTILAGKIPKKFHEKKLHELSEYSKWHKEGSAKHQDYEHEGTDADKHFASHSIEQLHKIKQKYVEMGAKGSLINKIQHHIDQKTKAFKGTSVPYAHLESLHQKYESKPIKSLEQHKSKIQKLKDATKDKYEKKKLGQELAIIQHHLEQKKAEAKNAPKEDTPPHPDNVSYHNIIKQKTPEQLKEDIKFFSDELKNNKFLDEHAKKKFQQALDIAQYYLKQKQNEKAESTTDKKAPIAGEAIIAGKKVGGVAVDNGDGTVNFTWHGKYNGKSGQHTKTISADKFKAHPNQHVQDFYKDHHKILVEDHPLHGDNLAHHGIDHNNPKQVYTHTVINTDNKGYSAEKLKDTARDLMRMLEGQNKIATHSVGDSHGAKRQVMKNLASALSKNEDFKAFAKEYFGDSSTHPFGETPEERAVSAMISAWAISSNEGKFSVAMQIATAKEFGLDKAGEYFKPSDRESAENILSKHEKALRAFVREQYNQTQKFFKEHGITHVPIVRGMSLHNEKDLNGFKVGTHGELKMRLAALSSFSANHSKAFQFATDFSSGQYKILMTAMIPVERVLGSVQTGFGCMNEHEFVVLGPKGEPDTFMAYVWDSADYKSKESNPVYKNSNVIFDMLAGEYKAPSKSDAHATAEEKALMDDLKTNVYHTHMSEYQKMQIDKLGYEHAKKAYHQFKNDLLNNKKMSETMINQKKGAMQYIYDKYGKGVLHKSLTKSDKIPEIQSADATPENADWTKTSKDVDIPTLGSKAFDAWLKAQGMTYDQFKKLPIYKFLTRKQKKVVVRKSDAEEKTYYQSDRYAYRTHHKNPIYIPVNRIETPFQTEDALDEDKVRENMEKIKNGEALPPLIIGYKYNLHDGHHRLEAAKRLGHTHVPCIVGGRNKRRVKAAEKRYREVWKSMGVFVKAGRLLIKKAETAPKASSDQHWVTIRGVHVLINGKGDILQGPAHLKGRNVNNLPKTAPAKKEKSNPDHDPKVAKIWKSFAKYEPEISAQLKKIAKAHGVTLEGYDFRLKTHDSFQRKVKSNLKEVQEAGHQSTLEEEAKKIKDAIRYTIASDHDKIAETYHAVVKSFEKDGYKLMRTKNTWGSKTNPYYGVNCIFQAPNGVHFEVQFHSKESLDVKEKIHLLYEEQRLDTTPKERKEELHKQMMAVSQGMKMPKDIHTIENYDALKKHVIIGNNRVIIR
jgi:hypothetical protein